MENIFKELFLQRSQGVSLSIADAKVDTFYILTKHYYYFFLEKIQEKSQCTDFQAWRILGIFKSLGEIDKYMLQNIKIERFWRNGEMLKKIEKRAWLSEIRREEWNYAKKRREDS